MRAKYPEMQQPEDFERWLNHLKANRTKRTPALSCTGTPEIAVVFHIIHNGEPVGAGVNLGADQVEAQLAQLNADFTGVVDIDFCLAGAHENGNTLPELGINRVDRNDKGWTAADFELCSLDSEGNVVYDFSFINEVVKPATQWDPDRYLNIWVIRLLCLGNPNPLGYAQFPGFSGLPGLPPGDLGASSDGIVIAPGTLGSIDNPNPDPEDPQKARGRTATHELGHFFGLRHTWGDGNFVNGDGCAVDDFCDDTPLSAAPNTSCTVHFSCGSADMTENYMEYTPDFCRNVFTPCQNSRVQVVLNNSPRRMTLCNSGACCIEEAILAYHFENTDGTQDKDFCEGEKIFLDASATLGDNDYFLELSHRPLGSVDNFTLIHSYGWVSDPLPELIDLLDWAVNDGYALPAGYEYQIKISINGVCGEIESIAYFNHHVNNTEVIFELQNEEGETVSAYCEGESIFLDATATQYEIEYFVTLYRRPVGSPLNFELFYLSEMTNGEIGVLNLTEMVESEGGVFEAGYEYRITVAIRGICFGWRSTTQYFPVSHCILLCQPPEDLRCEIDGEGTQLAWDPVAGATAYNLLIQINHPDCNCSGMPDSLYTSVSSPVYDLPLWLSKKCFRWQVETVCGELEPLGYSEAVCYGPTTNCDIIELEERRNPFLTKSSSSDFKLYPNPNSGRATLVWTLSETTNLVINIYSSDGRLLQTVDKGILAPGPYKESWTLGDFLDEGLYFLEWRTDKGSSLQKVLMID